MMGGALEAIDGGAGDNPRYAAYALAHGMTPDAMMEHDRIAYPGGCMCGFVLWMSEQKRAFWEPCPEAFFDRGRILDQDAWTSFLQSVANTSAALAGRKGEAVCPK